MLITALLNSMKRRNKVNNMRWVKPSVMIDYNIYKNEIIQNGSLPISLPKTRNFDLDDMDNLKIAEAVFSGLFL